MTPQTFGRYQIVAELGRGGMAIVYHAYDPRFNRNVALKILPREFLFEQMFRERFDREAQAIAALEHWAIVPVYDYGEENDQPFFVMRYMPGGSLLERIAQSRLSLDETIPIVERIAAALDFAHRKNVIHRDVKPANILFDEESDAYLSDFGIVRLAEATTPLTGSGFIGTPIYIAPEMTRKGGVTPLVDVYALGVTLFQMLSGTPPYEADTPMGTALAHATEPIPNIVECCPSLPVAMQAVIEGALAKDPADRYQSAGTLAADLRGIASQGQVSRVRSAAGGTTLVEAPLAPTIREAPTPGSNAAVQPETTSRSPWPIFLPWALGVLGLVIVVGLALALWPRGESVGEESLADVPPPTREQLPTATNASSPTATLSIMLSPTPVSVLDLAEMGVSANADWTPHIEEINGVEMVLVPAGCFLMGSEEGNDDEAPMHEVCFERPFWIDRTEVTNMQYGSSGCFDGPERPRECVTWSDAQAYCEHRGGRLPTAAEWEYAARGPSNFLYPWGNEFESEYAVYDGNANGQTANVGSKPGGASWVGALDMSGNVWEWTTTIYDQVRFPYPYVDGDGRNGANADSDLLELRGGSWRNAPFDVRASMRGRADRPLEFSWGGLRCVLDYGD